MGKNDFNEKPNDNNENLPINENLPRLATDRGFELDCSTDLRVNLYIPLIRKSLREDINNAADLYKHIMNENKTVGVLLLVLIIEEIGGPNISHVARLVGRTTVEIRLILWSFDILYRVPKNTYREGYTRWGYVNLFQPYIDRFDSQV